MTQENFNLKKLTKPILVLTTLAFLLGLNRNEKKIIDIDDLWEVEVRVPIRS